MLGAVVIVGRLPINRRVFEPIVWRYGWRLRHVDDFQQLETSDDHHVVAVLFDLNDVGEPSRGIQMVAKAAPEALPIICHRFSERIHGLDMATSGRYHALHYPFATNELQLSLGFAWEANRKRQLHSSPAYRPHA